jgi:hypothetical protein
MRRSFSLRIATALLVVSLAMPAMAAGKRDDSPLDPMDRIARFVNQIIHSVLDLSSDIGTPKP